MHPDEQKLKLITQAEEEMRKPVREEDIDRIKYYLTVVNII